MNTGINSDGQFGNGNFINQNVLTNTLFPKAVTEISASMSFVLILTSDGKVYGAGSAIGRTSPFWDGNSTSIYSTFTDLTKYFPNTTISSLTSGNSHSLFLINAGIWMWRE